MSSVIFRAHIDPLFGEISSHRYEIKTAIAAA